MMKHLLAWATLFLIMFPTIDAVATDNIHCATLLSPEATLEQINDTIRDLAALRLNLDIAKIKGSNSFALTRLNADYEQKEQALIVYLEANKIMSREDLMKRIRQEIIAIQSEMQITQRQNDRSEEEANRRKEQEEHIRNYVIDGTRLIMHRIEPGDFMMGEVGKQVHVTLTKPFYMSATKTTQIVWRKIAKLANSRFSDRYQVDIDPSMIRGDDTRPVERVSYNDVQMWINGLNELSQTGEQSLVDLIPGHKKGDIYRLPTEAEWEFVVRGRGLYNDTFHFGNDESLLGDYAWFNGNSIGTQPVAKKKPLMIGNMDFYDVYGNVSEWVQDWYSDNLPGGIDPNPRGPKERPYRVVSRGSAWDSSAFIQSSAFRLPVTPEHRGYDVGFRLAREVR